MSEQLERFRKDFLHANTWPQRKDGVPLNLLDALPTEEAKIAEEEMIQALSPRDSWPALGLGHLRSTRALPDLYVLLEKVEKSGKVPVAHAIFQINQDAKMIDIALDETRGMSSEYQLIEAFYLLRIFQDDRVRALLEGFRQDARYLVAYNATVVCGGNATEVVARFRRKRERKDWWKKWFGKWE